MFRLVDAGRLASDDGIPRLPHAGQGIDAAGAASTIGMVATGEMLPTAGLTSTAAGVAAAGVVAGPKNVPGQFV